MYACFDPDASLSAPANSTAASNGSDTAVPGEASSSSSESLDDSSVDVDSDNRTAVVVVATPSPTAGEGEEGADSPPLPPPRPTILSVSPEVAKAGEALMVVGTGFGQAVGDVRVMVGGRDCRDPELCHLVCRLCGDEDKCEFDEMCMEDGLSKVKVREL